MKIEIGQKLSESQFYSVVKIVGDKMQLVNDNGENIVITKEYAEKCLNSAHNFSKEEKVTKTDLANLFLSNSRIAMTVCFFKQVKEADVVSEIVTEVSGAKIADIEKAIKKGVKKAIIGEERIMIGRHYGSTDEFGRVHFVDMEVVKDSSKSYDTRMRLVDPRTICWLVVNNIKYILK